eukprot:TRINITY_DN3115_c0_g1_i1.p1 TRINITY_DN3115_c0_g1~~TRINITY_DN3115_c0_g1_i1.p1  ORF type:complete len:217 (+),score=16.92 TRINITY_DN3115_c0_g1_i1:112-762(+)
MQGSCSRSSPFKLCPAQMLRSSLCAIAFCKLFLLIAVFSALAGISVGELSFYEEFHPEDVSFLQLQDKGHHARGAGHHPSGKGHHGKGGHHGSGVGMHGGGRGHHPKGVGHHRVEPSPAPSPAPSLAPLPAPLIPAPVPAPLIPAPAPAPLLPSPAPYPSAAPSSAPASAPTPAKAKEVRRLMADPAWEQDPLPSEEGALAETLRTWWSYLDHGKR